MIEPMKNKSNFKKCPSSTGILVMDRYTWIYTWTDSISYIMYNCAVLSKNHALQKILCNM